MKREMKLVPVSELVDIIKATDGRVFRVTFVKKTDHTFRDMVARFGVTSALKGGKLRFNPNDKNLLVVYDMEKEDYRSINIDGIVSASVDGIDYVTLEAVGGMDKTLRKAVYARATQKKETTK